MSAGSEGAATADDSRQLDATSASWVRGLTSQGHHREDCTRRLHAFLLAAARHEARRRSGLSGVTGRELEDLAHQAADDAVISILRRVPDFRGDSRFTTWAYSFALHEVSSKLARHTWRDDGVRLDDTAWDRVPGRHGLDPEDMAEYRELVLAVRAAVQDALTPHQRHVFCALVLRATPPDVVALEVGSNRNAIYKTMFDARLKLRAHLVASGHLVDASRSGSPTVAEPTTHIVGRVGWTSDRIPTRDDSS